MIRKRGAEISRKKEQATWGKITVKLEEITPDSNGQRRKIKEISTKGKTIQTKQNIPKKQKKILSTIGRE